MGFFFFCVQIFPWPFQKFVISSFPTSPGHTVLVAFCLLLAFAANDTNPCRDMTDGRLHVRLAALKRMILGVLDRYSFAVYLI